jgi:hypothetical protein
MADQPTDAFADLEKFRLGPDYHEKVKERLEETATSRAIKAAKARRLRASFIPAVPLADAYRWHQIGPNCLIIMLLLHRWAHLKRAEWPVTIGDGELMRIGMSAWRRDAALDALEKAGLIRVERHRGRLPRIWLVN